MQNEINTLKLSLANLIEEIKKQPDPYFEDLSTVLSLYSTIHKSEKEVVELYNKYIPQISKEELHQELITGLKCREDYSKFAPYIIEALFEYGGARKCNDAIPDIIRKAAKANILTDDDEIYVNSGTELKGWNKIRFVRNGFRETGYIVPTKDGGAFGIWEITDKAKKWYERWSQAI